MKKVGILTSSPSFINNYGAVLQAYALTTMVDKLGADACIIKYADKHEYVQGRVSIKDRLKGVVFNSNISLRTRVKIILNKLMNRSVYPVFEKFQREYIDFHDSEYIDYCGLEQIAKQFYAFIVGSDQVWNPNVHHGVNDPGYFLQFVPKGIKRIAYAPSMGVNVLPDSCKTNLKEYLSAFDNLSIREESGRRIIRDVCNMDVPVVLDPTMLLEREDYDKIKSMLPDVGDKYILYYKFGSIKCVETTVRKIAKHYGYKVVCVPAGLDTGFKQDYRIGPREFIDLISNASLVCTDSFHATVFSIIYNKPFLAFCREDETRNKVTMNSRITGILDMLALREAWAGMGEHIDIHALPKVNYSRANTILAEKRKEAIAYLKNALEINE